MKIGEASFRCYILPGPDGTHVRVLSQRDTLRALGATYNPSVVGKNTEKTGDTKPNVSGIKNAKISNDSKSLGGDAKLRFLPPRGGAPVTGYTTAQVIQFLRDWSGRRWSARCGASKNTSKSSAPKLVVSGQENGNITNDSKDLSGAPKLRFLPPRGGVPVTSTPTDTRQNLTVNGWRLCVFSTETGEPRIRDLNLAERLGYSKTHNIRDLIRTMLKEGRLRDVLVFRVTRKTPQGGRPGEEFWLTEAQALTPRAGATVAAGRPAAGQDGAQVASWPRRAEGGSQGTASGPGPRRAAARGSGADGVQRADVPASRQAAPSTPARPGHSGGHALEPAVRPRAPRCRGAEARCGSSGTRHARRAEPRSR